MYGWGIDTIFSLVTQVLVCLLFVLVCLLGSSKAQLNVSSFLRYNFILQLVNFVEENYLMTRLKRMPLLNVPNEE